MKQNSLNRIVVALFFLLLLTSCFDSPSPPLRLGTNRWPGYEPLYLARELGFLDLQQIRLVEYPSASEALYDMRDHTIEIAALTLDEALLLLQDKVDIAVILIMDFSAGGDAVIAKPEITDLSQIKGKRIAYEAGAVGAIMVDALLEKAGLKTDQVTLINRTVNHHLKTYEQNEADVIITFEPVVSELLRKGGHRLFDSKSIPDRIVDVLVVHRDVLKKYPVRIKSLINTWFQALQKMNTDPTGAMPILASRLHLSAEQMKLAYQGLDLPDRQLNLYYFTSKKIERQAEKLQNLMLKRSLLQHAVELDSVFDGSALGDCPIASVGTAECLLVQHNKQGLAESHIDFVQSPASTVSRSVDQEQLAVSKQ